MELNSLCYVYLINLELSIKNNSLFEERLGRIIDIQSIDVVGKNNYKAIKYIVEGVTGKRMEVNNDFNQLFKIAPVSEVIKTVEKLLKEEKITQEDCDKMMELINKHKR